MSTFILARFVGVTADSSGFYLVEKSIKTFDFFFDGGAAKAVIDLKSVDLSVDEPELLELLQMLGDGGSTQGELVGDVARNAGSCFRQILQYGQSGRVGNNLGKLCQLLKFFAEFIRFGHADFFIEV
jgi:hypothetical protein